MEPNYLQDKPLPSSEKVRAERETLLTRLGLDISVLAGNVKALREVARMDHLLRR